MIRKSNRGRSAGKEAIRVGNMDYPNEDFLEAEGILRQFLEPR